ncbi:class C sortase [Faecalimonas sp.]
MKKHLSTIFIVILFLTGFSVLLYPTVSNYINSKHQTKAIASYEERMKKMDTSSYNEIMEEARKYNEQILSNQARFAMQGEELEKYLHLMGSTGGAIGYIEIDSIDVTLPLYLGDSSSVLSVGAGTMPGSSLPIGGRGTHAVITGHRGLPSSKLFTHLDKVKEGDVFVLHVLNETLTYQVDQIHIVEPKDLTKLEIEPEQDYVTLMTCTPYGINTHRMLVRGHRIENNSQVAGATRVVADATQVDFMLIAPVLAIPLVLLLVATLFWRDRKNTKKRKDEGYGK